MIKTIKAREILNSKGGQTVEVKLRTDDGVFVSSVPSGTSKGKYEALEIKASQAVKNIEEKIFPKIKREDFSGQKKIDKILIELDGTKNKSKLGANAILAVSMAVCRAGAAVKGIPLWKHISQISGKNPNLPGPVVLMLEGGLHGKNNLELQEFMVFSSAGSYGEKLNQAIEVYREIKKIMGKTGLGLEGGFSPSLNKTEEALDLIMEAIEKAGRKGKVKIALDAAASSFYSQGSYNLEGKNFTKKELLDFYSNLLKKYPIISLEDPFGQEDWTGFQEITKKFSERIAIVGDDLLTTNIGRIKEAQRKKACNGLILKPNQIGTVSETIEAAKLAQSFGWKVMVSHRSGETMDDFISDLAFGIGADYIKSGAPSQKERMAKYNRLLEIEKEI